MLSRLDANYWRGPARGQTVQPSACADAAQDSRSAHGLLYLAAVRDDWREQEHCQGAVDTDPSLVSYRHVVGYRRSTCTSSARARLPGSARVGTRCGQGWWSARRPGPRCDPLLRRSFHAAGSPVPRLEAVRTVHR